jgi:4-amino-4-deoxy-L-arabinose transferase-like glycosyltransferase
VIALPWYALCYWRNGWPFINEFFVVHTFGRLAAKELGHGQPWWYYLPILVGALLPWTPLLGLLARRKGYEDPRRQFLLGWFLFTVVFFSVMLNKLAGYILPALPAAAALAAIALDEVERARVWLVSCALLLVVFPITAQVLPAAVLSGLSRAPKPVFDPLWLGAVVVAAVAWMLEARGRRLAAVLAVAVGAGLGIARLKATVAPELERSASARALWRQVEASAGDVCLGELKRDWVYGLNYYAGKALPRCDEETRPVRILPAPGDHAIVTR